MLTRSTANARHPSHPDDGVACLPLLIPALAERGQHDPQI